MQAEVQHDALILAERLNQFLKPAIRLPEKSLMNKQIELNNFKNELRNCWDNGAELWSCVLFSKRYSNEQLKQFESTLGPPDSSGKLLRTITVPIDELTTLSYWYFGDSEDDIAALTGCVDRIEQSLSAVPTPGFVCPKELTAADRKLLRWTSLFYWVAWTCNEAYLQAELDHLEKHTIFEWQVNRMQEITGYGDPWKWMLLQAGGSEHLRQIENDLAGDGRSWPDVMHGYVNLEFFKGSIAAIDLFCSRLSTPGETHPVPRTVTPRQKQKWKRQTRQQKVKVLDVYLRSKHDRGKRREPLHYKEIMADLDWSQPELSRTMNALFQKERRGMGGLAYYQTVFVREDLARGITTSRMDGRLDVDGVISEEVDDFDE